MDLWKLNSNFIDSIRDDLQEKGIHLSPQKLALVIDQVKEEVLANFVRLLIDQIETILDIDPALSDREILQKLAKNIVEFMGAEAATVRIFDTSRGKLVIFGSYPDSEQERKEAISMEDTIAGEVIKTRNSYVVPDIAKEERYGEEKKGRMAQKGVHSMLAIPISLLRFSLKDEDAEGILQIYFKEKDRKFTNLDVQIAETLARRISYVIARKRILDLQELSNVKDRIIEQVFLKLGRREGVKMKEIFNLVIPELADIMRIQRCALFAVTEDRHHAVLEAGFPEEKHGIGQVFSVSEPYIDTVVNQRGPFGDFEHERIYPNFIHIHHPQESHLLTPNLKRFLLNEQIHSILYIPLKINEIVQYFLVFDAQSYYRRFTDEKIEIFIFLGKELMKAQRIEKMDDILHDFKNPAIAIAGFARRVQKYIEEDFQGKKEKIEKSMEVIRQEATRLEELALSLYEEGKETIVDLVDILERRTIVNTEAINELERANIQLCEENSPDPLPIQCSPLLLARVFDNLLNNATKAIPEEGGQLRVRSYRLNSWAVAEITNTGEIPSEDHERYLQGAGQGRGLHITGRLVKRMGGQIELESQKGVTQFRVLLPLLNDI
jgi:signal transduction histidine kinase